MSQLNPNSLPPLGTTVYWQQSPAIFHGVAVGTDAAVIKQFSDDKTCLLVLLTDLSTTANG